MPRLTPATTSSTRQRPRESALRSPMRHRACSRARANSRFTGALSAANQNLWIGFIKQRMAEKHPGLKLLAIRPSDDDRDKAFTETQTVLKVYPRVNLIMSIAAPAVPGAAEAVQQANRRDVEVIGLSLPNLCKKYIHDGVVQQIVLCNTKNLGQLTVNTAAQLVEGKLQKGVKSFEAGRLGKIEVRGSEVILGA